MELSDGLMDRPSSIASICVSPQRIVMANKGGLPAPTLWMGGSPEFTTAAPPQEGCLTFFLYGPAHHEWSMMITT